MNPIWILFWIWAYWIVGNVALDWLMGQYLYGGDYSHHPWLSKRFSVSRMMIVFCWIVPALAGVFVALMSFVILGDSK
jgi:hypothetical protein